MTTELKDIVVRPKWFKWAYIAMFVVLAYFTFTVLDDLTNRVNEANSRADANEAGVAALSDQVKGLGATPVVTPSDLPEKGDTGADGLPGLNGAIGLPGLDGSDGTDGTDGTDGRNGETIIGPPGPSGSDGQDGQNGTQGATGEPGATVVGPTGPQGPIGPVGPEGPRGSAGTDGKDGADGADGSDGQTCPDGYTLDERTLITTQNPLGEPGFVCVQNSTPPDSETPVSG